MSKERETEEEREAESLVHDPVEAEIANFASKIGEETGNKYFCYIYRMIKNEESGRMDRPFLKRYSGIEPDPQEIAEKYRGGKYLITFTWKLGKQNKSKSYTLDIDSGAYPPMPKEAQSNSLMTFAGNTSISDPMKLQLAMMQMVGDIMKEAYKNNSPQQAQVSSDPVEQFGDMLQAMEHNYSTLMSVQSKMFERVLAKNMEIKYGLEPEAASAPDELGADQGILSKYEPLLKEIVGGLKTFFSLFGDNNKLPEKVVKKVQADERFKELRGNPKALMAVGQTLRREFGDEKAASIMRSFGVIMKIQPSNVIKTPDMPGIPAADVVKTSQAKVKGNGKAVSPAGLKKPVSGAMVKAGVSG